MAFEVIKEKNKSYHFRLKTPIGQVVLTGIPQDSEAAVEEAIQSVVKHASKKNFEKRRTTEGRLYFVLKNNAGQTIGKGMPFWGNQALEMSIEKVIENAKQPMTIGA